MDINQIKKLREETGAGVMEVKAALEEAGGDEKKAKEILRKKGLVKAKKKAGRQTAEGRIYSYVHTGGRVGVLVEVRCETDFVARNEEFEKLCKELALQIASMAPKDVDELIAQDYIRDPKIKVGDLIAETIAKTGENIVVKRFVRFELGEE